MMTTTNKAGTISVNLGDHSDCWEAYYTASGELICEGTVREGDVAVSWWQTTVAERTWRLEDEIEKLVVQAEIKAYAEGC